MLMDFQIDSNHMATAELLAESEHPTKPQVTRIRASHEVRSFEFPRLIWVTMFALYATFFAAMVLATGHGASANFALTISVGYTLVYFGVATILNRVNRSARHGPNSLDRGEGIVTATGWMSNAAVYGQVLVVPLALVLFAIGFAVIRASV